MRCHVTVSAYSQLTELQVGYVLCNPALGSPSLGNGRGEVLGWESHCGEQFLYRYLVIGCVSIQKIPRPKFIALMDRNNWVGVITRSI